MKTDLRVIKTKRNIENTFVELLREMSFEKITVQKILDTALISKGTFYTHYIDKYDLGEKVIKNYIDRIQSDLVKRRNCLGNNDSYEKVWNMFINSLPDILIGFNVLSKVHIGEINVEYEIRKIIEEEIYKYIEEHQFKLVDIKLQSNILAGLIIMYLKNINTYKENSLDLYKYLDIIHELTGLILKNSNLNN